MLNKLHIYNLFVLILFQTCHLAQHTLSEITTFTTNPINHHAIA